MNDRSNADSTHSKWVERSTRRSNQPQESSNQNEVFHEEKQKYKKQFDSNKISGSTRTEKHKNNESPSVFDFDGSHLVSDRSKQKDASIKSKTNIDNTVQLDKPKQPRKEGTSSSDKDHVRSRSNSSIT